MQQHNLSEAYRQPSFFGIESTRDRLQTELRAERFPVIMADMARRAAEMHKVYQNDNWRQLTGYDRKAFLFELSGRDEAEKLALLFKFGLTKNREFDVSEYMDAFYKDPASRDGFALRTNINLPVQARHKIIEREDLTPDSERELRVVDDHLRSKYAERLREVKERKPALIRFSERYIDLFGVTFVGNGFRCLRGYEGLNFLDDGNNLGIANVPNGLRKSTNYAVQLHPEQEHRFIDSIVSVQPLGILPVLEKEIVDGKEIWNPDFNGWGGYAEAFLIKFRDRAPMVGYLNRSFATFPLNGEGWLVFSARRAEGLEEKVA